MKITMKTMPGFLAGCSITILIVSLITGLILIIILIGSIAVWEERAGDLRPYLNKLKPGMTRQQVESHIPSFFFDMRYECSYNHVHVGTYINSTNEMPSGYLFVYERTFYKWVDYETARIYFNTNDMLMGIYYIAPPARDWHPKWIHK